MKTQVLIIGGGFAGVATAQNLSKNGVDTLLVDKKDYFEVTYAVLRDVADPERNSGQGRRRYSDLLSGKFVHSGVVELKSNEARLENGVIVSFDHVVIASGSRYPSLPLAKSVSSNSIDARNIELAEYHRQLKQASEVLIIGGGVVGVELAGEIAYAMPNLKVILAHRSSALLDGFKPKAQLKALKQLERLQVEVQFNKEYEAQGSVYIDQNSKTKLTPDLVFAATGTLPNNEFLTSFFSHIVNERGLVKVEENLQVKGEPNMFAIGDIADVGEAKLGYLALEQGKYVAKTIVKLLAGKHNKGYKRNPFMALVPTGQKSGVVQLPFWVSTWNGLVNIKQKDLFISKTFNEFSK